MMKKIDQLPPKKSRAVYTINSKLVKSAQPTTDGDPTTPLSLATTHFR